MSTKPIFKGFDYQSLLFWKQVTRLLRIPCVKEICYENSKAKGFDDVTVHYTDEYKDRGKRIKADYFQAKNRLAVGESLSSEKLLDPGFLNRKDQSFLQRVKELLDSLPNSDKDKVRFYLVIPAYWDSKDILFTAGVISTENYAFDTAKMRNSKNGKLKCLIEEWCKHLDCSCEELYVYLNIIRFQFTRSDDEELTILNQSLEMAGLCPIDLKTLTNPYYELIKNLFCKNISCFTRDSLIPILKEQGLYLGPPVKLDQKAINIAIRSYRPGADYEQIEPDKILCLCDCYLNGKLPESQDEQNQVCEKLENFISKVLKSQTEYNLYLSTRLSIAFAAGFYLNPKARYKINLVTKDSELLSFRFNGECDNKSDDVWTYEKIIESNDSKNLAIGISVTHDVQESTKEYLEGEFETGTFNFINFKLKNGVGNHTMVLSQILKITASLKNHINTLSSVNEKRNSFHIFASGPVEFMFRLGQELEIFGKIQLYEFDYDSQTYKASFFLTKFNTKE